MAKKEKTVIKARRVRILDQAVHDIEQLANFIANNNQQPLNGVKVTEVIFETISKIGKIPFAFRKGEQLHPKQKFTVGSMFILDNHL